jgi:hypothetical protein
VALARRLAIGLVCLLVRLVYFLVVAAHVVAAGLAFVTAGLVMAVIGLAILAFMAAEAKCGRAARPQGCAGSSWSAAPATSGATQVR